MPMFTCLLKKEYYKKSSILPLSVPILLWSFMNIFFITILTLLFGASLYLASFISSIICSFFLLLIVWTRLFSKRIIKKSFKNLIPIKNTCLHYTQDQIIQAFLKNLNISKPEIFLDPLAKNLQLYCFGGKNSPQIITSKTLIEELSKKDLHDLFHYTSLLHKENTFITKEPFVALLIYVGNIGRHIDSLLSFALGIKTVNGEPKAITRKPLFFFLNKLNLLRKKNSNTLKPLLKHYSYLSVKHQNPILSPLSVTDKAL